MRLFYLINGWAGRSEWLDGALRFFYVGAVPLLWTALAALLIFAPRLRDASSRDENNVMSRGRIAGAGLLALSLSAVVVCLVYWVQAQFLSGSPISPRPFMTHWVNALIVEPNDNTFPSFEVMTAAVAATLLWAMRPGAGVLAWFLVFVLGFARIFCGMNYPGDCIAGAFLGGALGLVSLAALRVPLQLPILKSGARRLRWRVSHQAIFGSAALAGFVIFAVFTLTTSSPHASKFKPFWKTSAASAAPKLSPNAVQKLATSTLSGIHEGEGGTLASEDSAPMSEPGKLLLSSRAARLDGHQPEAEVALMRALSTPDLGHRVIGVNVSQVKAGNTPYRCAAIRFEVVKTGTEERQRVAQTAAACVKRAFHIDNQLQHVDVLGVDLRPSDTAAAVQEYSHGESATHSHSQQETIAPRHGVRLVFTASVERDDLIVENKPAWVNWSGLDGGAWLRARSALYIDNEVLPASEPTIAVEKVLPAPTKTTPQIIVPKAAVPKTVVPSTVVPKTVVPKTIVPKTAPQKSVAPQKKRSVVRKRSSSQRRRIIKRKRRRYRRSR